MANQNSKKEYLSRYLALKRRVTEIENEIEELRAHYTGSAIKYSDMPSAPLVEHDLSDYVARLDPLLNRLKRRQSQALKEYQKIEITIERMSIEEEKEILRLRYLRGLKWEDIADHLGYSLRRVYQIHGMALLHLKIK